MKITMCEIIGHKPYIGKDESTIYCERCRKDVAHYKKGLAYLGIDMYKKRNKGWVQTILPLFAGLVGLIFMGLAGNWIEGVFLMCLSIFGIRLIMEG